MYLFERDAAGTWLQRRRYTASTGEFEDRLGIQCVVHTTTNELLCSAPLDDVTVPAPESGSIYRIPLP